MDYADHLEKVKNLYEPKIRALLKRIIILEIMRHNRKRQKR